MFCLDSPIAFHTWATVIEQVLSKPRLYGFEASVNNCFERFISEPDMVSVHAYLSYSPACWESIE